MERSASEPGLASQVGNLAKNGKARKLDNLRSLDGRVHVQAGRLNWGSPVSSKPNLVSSNKPEGEGEEKWCRVADESVVVMNLQPMKAGNGLEGKTEGTASERCWAKGAKSSSGCEGTKVNQSVRPRIERTWEKTTEVEMPRGTRHPGVTSQLEPSSAQQTIGEERGRLP
ncbi:hypothetical protein [Calderihabitans maritimus]|uniref:Uncharacterized protein n=1 Tax=Calderihabitans maritimus TaxID=1246530 RepID=A0A1Z5HS82_9FIRM|nr:hypothetical protein [Calderihabitans maritimus]GAW92386.1 hypothetical protein I633_17855 [Calderihabitans maritimus]